MPQKSITKKSPFKLTKKSIETNCPFAETNQAQFYFDTEVKGFGLRVSRSSKTFIVQGRSAGKKVRVKLGTWDEGMTPEAARKKALDELAKMRKGIDPNEEKRRKNAKSITVEDIWLDYKKTNSELRPKTIEIYEDSLKLLNWNSKEVTSITREMIEARVEELLDPDKRKLERSRENDSASSTWQSRRKPRSTPSSGKAQTHQALRILRSLLNHAIRELRCEVDNPVKLLSKKIWKRVKVPRRQSHIHEKQFESWYQAVMTLDDVMRDYLLFCIHTGLRRNEAATLTWSNIDFDLCQLMLEGDKTKNHQDHCLPLPDYLMELLKRRRQLNLQRGSSSTYIFPGRKKNTHLVECKASIHKVTQQCNVKFMVHDLRRTFLTYAESLDLPLSVLKRLANHKGKIDVTEGYLIDNPERLRTPMERITKKLLDCANIAQPQIHEEVLILDQRRKKNAPTAK